MQGRRIRGAATVLIAMAATAAIACTGRGDDDSGPTEVPAEERSGIIVAFAPNPDQPEGEPGRVRIADFSGGQNRNIGPEAPFRHIKFSPGGAQIALATVEGETAIYDVVSGDEVTAIDGEGPVTSLSWSPGGETLAVVREDSVTFVDRDEQSVAEDLGAAPDANPLSWGWTPEGSIFAMVDGQGLTLWPLDSGEAAVLPATEFPGEGEDWVVRQGEAPREIGLVDLSPISGLPDGRAEYPVVLEADGSLAGGEPRYVSIYDWQTLPSPEFDAATAIEFPSVRKTCDPCRSADGSASVLVFWRAGNRPTPDAQTPRWPAATETFLAIEGRGGMATAINLGIQPKGQISVEEWQPVYDVVQVGR